MAVEALRLAAMAATGDDRAAAETEDDELALLVTAARDGDRGAFDEVYRRTARGVHGLLLARVPPREADDLVQEVFLTAWRRLDALREPAAFTGWIATIARHAAADWHRAPARRTEGEPPDDTRAAPGAAPSPEALAALAALGKLPDAYRETLLLRLVEGLSGPEIARVTGLTPDSVRVNLSRGMKRLRALLAGETQ